MSSKQKTVPGGEQLEKALKDYTEKESQIEILFKKAREKN